jgi:hypothetical protein
MKPIHCIVLCPLVPACMKLDEPANVLICAVRRRGDKWIKIVTRG